MGSVREIAEEIVAREGGFVNDPDDPGGATNHGVTIHTLRRLGIDVTRDSRINVADVRALTRAQAVDIYVEHYFTRPGLAALPEVLQASVFDMYVNAGGNAVKILQRLLGDMGYPCDPDGQVGPQTIRAAAMAHEAAPSHLADAYGIARRNYYYALGDRRPASRKFARRRDGGKGGWIVRAEEFIAPRYHLSEAQHRARVAAWA
ncbi:MAG: holin-associated N-acetylmuramidase [Tabrizicola sp.]|uniref:holin-associated N-acetylmuramidase n=1 Tax=Tabrizicola sp. TaxID=2005166 RepID=UPI002733E407|nr:holin-associated N-acetylmuramidase [Tabrizicola sp.]MDP3263393.1 holin-associated N-acetylmuramidase [Tabrizicola sp.]MDP3646750.1 holin-associated N-acetylmuramidase [Paracoccaceae bacterium]MDZ4066272.1 holin-associated N-acetylmuramidase [Tabrizicola sp.]